MRPAEGVDGFVSPGYGPLDNGSVRAAGRRSSAEPAAMMIGDSCLVDLIVAHVEETFGKRLTEATVAEAYAAWSAAAALRRGHKLGRRMKPVVIVDTLEALHTLKSGRTASTSLPNRSLFQLLIMAVPRGHVLIAAGTLGRSVATDALMWGAVHVEHFMSGLV